MILVAFIPGTRSTLSMELLRAMGATLLRDRYPIALWSDKSVQEAILAGHYRVTSITETYFEVEQFRHETRFYGTGLDSSRAPSDLAAKVMAFPAMARCQLHAGDRVIFTVRRVGDTCRSQSERGIFHAAGHHRLNYFRLLWHFEDWAKSAPCPIHYFDTDALMLAPLPALKALAAFAGLPGDPEKAAALVDSGRARDAVPEEGDEAERLYRKVRAKCR